MTLLTPVPHAETTPPRARGSAQISVIESEGGTRLSGLYQSGSLKVLFPRPRAGLEALLVNTAGGLTGGDRFSLQAKVGPGAHLTLTTQAAERAYRSVPGPAAQVASTVDVSAGGTLNWLPQEMIVFDGAHLSRSLHANLDGDARLLVVEPVVFGRTAMNERVTQASLRDRIEIRRDGTPLCIEALRLNGDVASHLGRSATGAGAGALATVIYAGPDAEAWLGAIRADLPASGGASLLADGCLCLRLLATDGYALRQTLLPILDRLTGHTMPVSWRL